MNKLKLYLVSAGLLVQLFVSGQTGVDSLVFKAMQDELGRNHENLKLADYEKPFFVSYSMSVSSRFEVVGSLGAVSNSYVQPRTAVGSVRLLTGDNHRTNDFTYDAQSLRFALPIELEYNELRRNFWLVTDMAYKYALQQYASKESFLKNNPKSDEEERMDDFVTQRITARIAEATEEEEFDRLLWEKNIARLSAIFKEYPRLQNSRVSFSGTRSVIYKTTSEGLKLKEFTGRVTLAATASVVASDGVRIADTWGKTLVGPADFQSVEELEQQIREFADGLMRLSGLQPFKEYYSGPVLFEDAACVQVFVDNLLQSGKLLAWRKPEGKPSKVTFDGRMRRKILDGRLTVKNYTGLKNYNGTPLLGAYEVDAEGIVPAKELVMVEEGILRRQLNGRIPTLKAPVSTGSSRFVASADQVSFLTAPGAVHIEVKDGLKPEKMKKALLKAAAEEGLDYAYIVRKIAAQASLIYRVDVKTGKETQVRAGDFAGIDLSKLKRLREISDKEKVNNFLFGGQVLSSLIYPSAILMDDVEINIPQLKKEKPTALTFPLER